jgi:putative PIN family toxin of toxin-antitoxin system
VLRAVVDPGVLLAAIITPEGTSGRLLRAAIDGQFGLVVSPLLLGELGRVLSRDKFRRYLSQNEASLAVRSLADLAELIADPEPTPTGLCPDPKDDYLVALARHADADYLVTGDRHLDGVSRPPVRRPSNFLALPAVRSPS